MEARSGAQEPESSRSPAAEFAPPEYIAAQLRSIPPKGLPSEAIAALPHVPQFGNHFGVKLVTKRHIKLCEALAMEACGAVLQIPIQRALPLLPPEALPEALPEAPPLAPQMSSVPFLWGYWVLDDKKTPVIKPKSRPRDEWILGNHNLVMPIRCAEYSNGKLGPWHYSFAQRHNLANTG